MQINRLRTYKQPDLSDHVAHFTGRSGNRPAEVPKSVVDKADWDRLATILIDRQIRAFPTFGNDLPAVCFTECTLAGIKTLMKEKRYTPCGIVFDKDFVFREGGGPAFYVRGDEWPHVKALPPELRFRATRWWPGAQPSPGAPALKPHLATPSEWTHEREWRVRGSGDPPAFKFNWGDIAFIISPHPKWQKFVADFVASLGGDPYGAEFMRIPAVVVAPDGSSVSDPKGLWTP